MICLLFHCNYLLRPLHYTLLVLVFSSKFPVPKNLSNETSCLENNHYLRFPGFFYLAKLDVIFFSSQLLASKNIFPSEIVQKCFSTSDGKIFLDPKIFFRQTYLSDVLTLATFYYINQVQVRLMEKYFWIQKYFSVRRALKMLKI